MELEEDAMVAPLTRTLSAEKTIRLVKKIAIMNLVVRERAFIIIPTICTRTSNPLRTFRLPLAHFPP